MGDFNTSTQVHDWEPGILSSGLFWTIPIDDRAISHEGRDGRARFRMSDVAVPDFHDFNSAVAPHPVSIPSHVSFDVRWKGGGARTKLHDTVFGFEGDFVDGPASIEFSTRQDGSKVVYRSDPAGQNTVSAGVGRERNGAFFH